jgi:hypothetical protein
MTTYFGEDDGVTGYGVRGDSVANTGVAGHSTTGNGVRGDSRDGFGVAGFSNGGAAVYGQALAHGAGVRGDSPAGNGVHGESNTGRGVVGRGGDVGVHGESFSHNFGVVGVASNAGIAAFNPNNNHAAYLASECCAAWFTGQVVVTGPLFKGGGGFRIDHPLDPAERYLAHSFVESPDMKNVYDGVALLDAAGETVVHLPLWFDRINAEFRYQLTAIGSPAPNLHVSQEIAGNRFKISGGQPNMKVCWQVTGIRQDAWANAHRIAVEEHKSADERGLYLHPELYGAATEKHMGRARHAPQKPQTPDLGGANAHS